MMFQFVPDCSKTFQIVPFKENLEQKTIQKKHPHRVFFCGEREIDALRLSLCRRKCGDTPVSPAPPCRTPFSGSSNSSLPPQITKAPPLRKGFLLSGGEREIRTPGTRKSTIDFESTAFDHSAISPYRSTY